MNVRAWLLRAVENLLILGFALMIAMVFGNVVLRYGFDSGIIVSEELSRIIFVWLTFGGAFLVAKDGGHLGMTSVVERLGRNGRWWCRLVAEALSLLCMGLVIVGSWEQTIINIDNAAPVTGIPQAAIYFAGFTCGVGIAALNLIALFRLLTGTMPDSELVIGTESEELVAHEAPGGDRKLQA